MPRSDVEEAHVLGVGLDELTPELHVLTHEHRAHFVGQRRLLYPDLKQGAFPRVHGGVAQLVEVHLPQTLQPLEVSLVVRVLSQVCVLGPVVFEVDLLLADQGRVQRRLGHVHEAALDQWLHLPEEERQEQRSDVRPVDVGVSQDDHLVVPGLGDVEVVGQPGTDGRDQRLDLGVLQHLVDAGALDVQDLPPDGQDGLGPRAAGVFGRATGRVALHDEQLALAGVPRRAVDELAREPGSVERRLPPGEVAGLPGGHPGPSGQCGLLQDLVGLFGVLLEPIGQLLVGRLLHQGAHGHVAELSFGLPFELGVLQAHRDDGGQALPDVLAQQVLVLLLQRASGPGVLVGHAGQGGLEPFLVHTALDGRDAVGEGVDALVEAGVPLQRDLHLHALLDLLERVTLRKSASFEAFRWRT